MSIGFSFLYNLQKPSMLYGLAAGKGERVTFPVSRISYIFNSSLKEVGP